MTIPPAVCDQTPAPKLTPYEKYRDFVRLDSHNFSTEIFKMKDPWIVLCHEGETIETSWKTMAASLRGVVRIGLLQRDERIVDNLFTNNKFVSSDITRTPIIQVISMILLC